MHKASHDQIGWSDVGGVYGALNVTAPTGAVVTALPLLNSPSQRLFQRTNGPGFFSRYNGLVTSLTRRLASGWMASLAYTYSRTEGLELNPAISAFASLAGQDPNDYVNLRGRLNPNDRPHIFNASGGYEIPWIGVQLSGNYTINSGLAYAPQVPVDLPQGRRNVYFEPVGSYRTPTGQWLYLRGQKTLLRRGPRNLELGVELRNALQQTSLDTVVNRVYGSRTFGVPDQYAVPRQLLLRVRANF